MQAGSGSTAEQFLAFLGEQQLLDAASVSRARGVMGATDQAIDTIILELGLLNEGKLAESQARFLGLQQARSDSFPRDLDHDVLPFDFLKRASMVPISCIGDQIVLATAKPFETDSARALGYFTKRHVEVRVALPSDVAAFFKRVEQLDVGEIGPAGEVNENGAVIEDDVERLKDVAREAPVIRQVNRMIATAVERQASDVHIEPSEDQVQVRFRIDGALVHAETLPKSMQPGIISRIKIMAKLNIAEHRLPQDGRIKLPIRGDDIDLRVSTIPTLYGESVVLRILNRETVTLDFPALGFSRAATAALRGLMSRSNGIVLVTGPTGSGKTTTLYAALKELNSPINKVFTVEDPVEYHLDGVNQTHVRPQIGLDFASVLRSILRQDPDIIMVGEIRDRETASVAVQASLTGHLVLSTVHTNSAAATISRLLDMGVEDYLLVSALRGVVGQRLVRKLCPICKHQVEAPSDLRRELGSLQSHVELKVTFEPRGCPACYGIGYRGRTTIYEILEITEPVRSLVISRAETSMIEKEGRRNGMVSLFECGMEKVAAGETTVGEVLKVTRSL